MSNDVSRVYQFLANLGDWKTKADKKKSAQLKVKEWYDVSVTNDEADAVCIGRYGANKTKVSNEIVEWGE